MSNGGVRVDACLPLQLKPVPADELGRRRTAVLGGLQVREPPTSSVFPRYERKDLLAHIASQLEALENKMDSLVALVLQEQRRRARDHAVNLELHGRGITFRWPTPVEIGATIEANLGLTLFPPREIDFLAEVESCEPEAPPGCQHLVSARFVAIAEGDRDEIHRFILNAQRQQRRSQTESV